MFYWPNNGQRKLYRQNAKSALVQTIIVLPAAILGFAVLLGVVTTLLGLPGLELAREFLTVAGGLVLFVQTHVLLTLAVLGGLCLLSSLPWIRIVTRSLAACLFSKLPELVRLWGEMWGLAYSRVYVSTLSSTLPTFQHQPPTQGSRFIPAIRRN